MEIIKLPLKFKVGLYLLVIAVAFPFGLILGPLFGAMLGNLLMTVIGTGGISLGNGLGMGLGILPGMVIGLYLAGILSRNRRSSLKPFQSPT